MKKMIMSLFLAVFLTAGLSAQSSDWDVRLLSKYSKEELTEMKSNTPEKLAYLNKVAKSGWVIMDLPAEKSNAHEIRGSVAISDLKNVNLFALGLSPEKKNYQYYRINGTNKMLVVLSEEIILSSK
ncbi:MAG: hypothetical protein K1X56_05860 [Flavobacteriales bacterium]|nr:hypothetical protein [Flavobacteriales bacterium]